MLPASNESSSHGTHGRVIVHADLDCFYCQVEHVRLGIPRSTPLAVQQWDGLIAINYEARKFGVKRGDRTAQAKRKCPQIVFVHVETIVKDGGRDGEVAAGRVARHIQSNSKAHCRRVERASIDEAYMDLTEEAARLCEDAEEGKAEDVAIAPETDLQGVAGHRLDPTNAFDRALLAGARLTAAMRSAVERELGFTVSAGIASNKVLAKLASSRNKPNKQTLVSAGASSEMLDSVPVRHLRGLGGKLGESVVSWSGAETASDLKGELVSNFGHKTGRWLWRICRGMDDEAVIPNLRPKSLSVCKSFATVRDRQAVLMWMRLLTKELADRIVVDRKVWSRRATKLTLQIISLRAISTTQATSTGAKGEASKSTSLTKSRTVDIPGGGGEPPTAESLVCEAMSVFEKTENALPCSRIALTAHDFVGLVSGRGSIASFLRVSPLKCIPPPSGGSPVCETVCARTAASNGSKREGGSLSDSARHVNDDECDGSVGSRASEALSPEGAVGTGDGGSGSESGSESSRSGDVGRSRCERNMEIPSTEPNKEPCPNCGEPIAPDKLPEHLDFHYAQGLQERYTREDHVAADIAARAPSSEATKRRIAEDQRGPMRRPKAKKRSPRRGSNGGATTRIDSFFKPA